MAELGCCRGRPFEPDQIGRGNRFQAGLSFLIRDLCDLMALAQMSDDVREKVVEPDRADKEDFQGRALIPR